MLKWIALAVLLAVAAVIYCLHRGIVYLLDTQTERETKEHNEQGWFFHE